MIEQRDAAEILEKSDSVDALHYLDPPYPKAVRKTKGQDHRYRHEMTEADHERLADLLRSLKGMVVISSYPGDLYERLFRGWHFMEWTGGQFCSTSNSPKRTERVWLNDSAWRNSRRRLFDLEVSA